MHKRMWLLVVLLAIICRGLHADDIQQHHDDYFHVLRNPVYSFNMLDEATQANNRQLILLRAREQEQIASNRLYVSASSTILADFQQTNQLGNFGYLMRDSSQIGCQASEVILFEAKLAVTGTVEDWFSFFGEFLYNPSQSVFPGPITSLPRNLIELSQGYVVIGNLKFFPVYVAAGKMTSPFGLGDTVNPFTLSVVSDFFSGLAYGAKAGVSTHGFNASCMLIQDEAEFRGLNSITPNPNHLRNYVVDASYTYELDGIKIRGGASYEAGSIFNGDFPVQSVNSKGSFKNPAYDFYLKVEIDNFTALAEFARTTKPWPGTYNPNAPLNQFKASHVQALNIGAQYRFDLKHGQALLASISFGQFKPGPRNSPWEQMSQFVAGLEFRYKHYLRFFTEYIHTQGYTPLNFISGGNQTFAATGRPYLGSTWSNQDARGNIITAGIQCTF